MSDTSPIMISVGGPSGIGAVSVVKALAKDRAGKVTAPKAVDMLRAAIAPPGSTRKVVSLHAIEGASERSGRIELLETGGNGPVPVGTVSAESSCARHLAATRAKREEAV